LFLSSQIIHNILIINILKTTLLAYPRTFSNVEN